MTDWVEAWLVADTNETLSEYVERSEREAATVARQCERQRLFGDQLRQAQWNGNDALCQQLTAMQMLERQRLLANSPLSGPGAGRMFGGPLGFLRGIA